jgi:hypothetical protein
MPSDLGSRISDFAAPSGCLTQSLLGRARLSEPAADCQPTSPDNPKAPPLAKAPSDAESPKAQTNSMATALFRQDLQDSQDAETTSSFALPTSHFRILLILLILSKKLLSFRSLRSLRPPVKSMPLQFSETQQQPLATEARRGRREQRINCSRPTPKSRLSLRTSDLGLRTFPLRPSCWISDFRPVSVCLTQRPQRSSTATEQHSPFRILLILLILSKKLLSFRSLRSLRPPVKSEPLLFSVSHPVAREDAKTRKREANQQHNSSPFQQEIAEAAENTESTAAAQLPNPGCHFGPRTSDFGLFPFAPLVGFRISDFLRISVFGFRIFSFTSDLGLRTSDFRILLILLILSKKLLSFRSLRSLRPPVKSEPLLFSPPSATRMAGRLPADETADCQSALHQFLL